MYPALAIAASFVENSLFTGIQLTPMKLVKLTYIAHGYYLAFNDGKPLLREAVQAWKYGPVVPPVYEEYKVFGRQHITEVKIPFHIGSDGKKSEYELPLDIGVFILNVADAYKEHTGLDLSTLTHRPGTPWDKVNSQHGGDMPRNVIIPNNIIEAHYKDLINERTNNNHSHDDCKAIHIHNIHSFFFDQL